MLYALSIKGRKIQAKPKRTAVCPECNQEVIPKCGRIVVWHWSHKHKISCDLWGEPESNWHLKWKKLFPANQVEVVMVKNGIRHRADIVANDGTVIELQHSPISPEEIEKREQFYGRMVWVFDVTEPIRKGRLTFDVRNNYSTFRWKMPRKHISFVRAHSFWDIGKQDLFWLKKMYLDGKCRGWGKWMNKSQFITLANGDRV